MIQIELKKYFFNLCNSSCLEVFFNYVRVNNGKANFVVVVVVVIYYYCCIAKKVSSPGHNSIGK